MPYRFKKLDKVIVNGIFEGMIFENEKGFILETDDQMSCIVFDTWDMGHSGPWQEVEDRLPEQRSNNHFWVETDMLTLDIPIDNKDLKYSKVIRKIKQMQQRFDNRKEAYPF